MAPTIKQANLVTKLLRLSQDPQSWISALAVVTLLGLSSGALESADKPAEAKAKFSKIEGSELGQADAHLASLDASKL